MITYRILAAKDAELYHALRLEALKNNPEAYASDLMTEQKRTMDQIRAHLDDPYVMTVGGYDGERMIAIASLHLEKLPKMAHRSTLTSVYVNPEYRGRRVSRHMMEYMIERVKKRGITKMYLYVMTHNASAIRAYRKFGFDIIGEDREAMKEPHGYVDEYLMVKYLVKPAVPAAAHVYPDHQSNNQ
ncbi:GNAT family N-acetyltransferase [Sporolactobacillus sp. CPB3-1]|uniref:GNAT family N-acetyltransferase n=1 Tax=Sporolactobacillus mangiferae TaxID=2940498 RepID=A0ABT0MCY1_9BACL|nr:GNAT family N-acetyltransferase [Sporolactobacillus mangiferae]MCL1632730.1 GNAT family N-acetyltransferase [Sporolactobacillus mangiferae]